MKMRWMLSEDGVTFGTELAILKGADVSFSDERDLDNGQIFFRRSIDGGLTFGKPHFTYFHDRERNPLTRCEPLYIRREHLCGGQWSVYWTGRFATSSGAFDLDRCQFTVKPETVDAYTCLLDVQDVKRNLLQVGKVTTNIYNLSSYEFTGCYFNDAPGQAACTYNPATTGWTLVAAPGIGVGYTLYVYARHRFTTECVGGTATPPSGTGWILLSDDCATDGTATYVKELSGAEVFALNAAGVITGTCEDGEAVPPTSGCSGFVQLVLGCDDPLFPSTWACLEPIPQTSDDARTLEGCLEYLVEQSECHITGIRSDFYGINPVGDAPGYVAGLNYVTGQATQTEAIVVLQKSDAKNPTATNPATIGEMTFKEMMKALNTMHQVFYFIDADGYLRLEHWIFWTFEQGIDLTALPSVNEPLAYEHLTNDIPRVERALWMEALSRDFVGRDIVYSGPCVNGSKTEEYSPGKITTDIGFVLSDPDAISNDGFVFLATTYTGSVYDTIIDYGAITGNYVANAPMSWANLERDFWTWNRYLPTGNMNGQDVTFDGYRPNIEQKEVRVALCCGMVQFDANDRITSGLGVRIGDLPAYVEKATFEEQPEELTLTLRYAY